MKYRDITTTGERFRLPASHPVLATLTIEPADWFKFEQMADDNPAVRILGHDTP